MKEITVKKQGCWSLTTNMLDTPNFIEWRGRKYCQSGVHPKVHAGCLRRYVNTWLDLKWRYGLLQVRLRRTWNSSCWTTRWRCSQDVTQQGLWPSPWQQQHCFLLCKPSHNKQVSGGMLKNSQRFSNSHSNELSAVPWPRCYWQYIWGQAILWIYPGVVQYTAI